ncbi:hypothetical protein PHYC_01625 [Phycisphaerales bacterium]|nr:hypothetical protein PHYC_01625 [Phycisphaerales bacterium]
MIERVSQDPCAPGAIIPDLSESPDTPKSGGNGRLIAGVVAGAGAAVVLTALVMRGGSQPQGAVAAVPAPTTNFFTEQQKFMREAMDMAREAQAMQRERMELMEREIRAAEEGYEPPSN